MPDEPTPRPSLPLHFLAGLFLLACFAAQCLYVASHAPLDRDEIITASPGPQYGGPFTKAAAVGGLIDPNHSPLGYYIAQFPVRHGSVPWFDVIGPRYQHRWLLRLPYVFFAMLLCASLWYVANRLYGRVAGLFALAIYCFSPQMVAHGSHIWDDGLAAWGFFGVVFLGIASAHTLYAAPGTLAWHDRWRRPILMGVALGIAVGAQFNTWIALPLAIAFLLYLVPGRRREASVMLFVATVIGFSILFAVYRFDWATMRIDVADFFKTYRPDVRYSGRYQELSSLPSTSPKLPFVFFSALLGRHHATLREAVHSTNYGLFAMVIAALLFWLVSRRARWFGNTAPLIAATAVPLSSVGKLWLWAPAVPLLFMFLAGVFADAIETRHRKLALGVSLALLVIHIGFGLARTLAAMS